MKAETISRLLEAIGKEKELEGETIEVRAQDDNKDSERWDVFIGGDFANGPKIEAIQELAKVFSLTYRLTDAEFQLYDTHSVKD